MFLLLEAVDQLPDGGIQIGGGRGALASGRCRASFLAQLFQGQLVQPDRIAAPAVAFVPV